MQNGHIFLLFLIEIIMNISGYVTVHILRSISCIHGHKNFIIEKYFEIFLDGYIIMRELRLTFEQMLSRSEKIRTVTS